MLVVMKEDMKSTATQGDCDATPYAARREKLFMLLLQMSTPGAFELRCQSHSLLTIIQKKRATLF